MAKSVLERDLKKSAVDEVNFNFCRSTGSDGNIKVLFSWYKLLVVLNFFSLNGTRFWTYNCNQRKSKVPREEVINFKNKPHLKIPRRKYSFSYPLSIPKIIRTFPKKIFILKFYKFARDRKEENNILIWIVNHNLEIMFFLSYISPNFGVCSIWAWICFVKIDRKFN